MEITVTRRLGQSALFCALLTIATHAQMVVKSSPDSVGHRAYTIRSCVSEFEASRIESTKAGYQYWFVGKEFLDGRTLKMSVVKPHGATHPPHRHSEDEFFFVLEGTAEFFLNGERKVVHPYASFYCPPNSEHGIRNAGDTELKYLVIKKYDTP